MLPESAMADVSLRPGVQGQGVEPIKLRRFRPGCDPTPDLPVEHLVSEVVYAPPGKLPCLIEIRRVGSTVWWRDQVRPWWTSSLEPNRVSWAHVYSRRSFLLLVVKYEASLGYFLEA